MRGHWLAGPHRTRLARRVIANGEHEIHDRCAATGKFAPRLGTKLRGVVAEPLQQANRVRIHLALWLRSGAIGSEFSGTDLVQDRFGDDRARRIARAEKQNVVGLVRHWPCSRSMIARPPALLPSSCSRSRLRRSLSLWHPPRNRHRRLPVPVRRSIPRSRQSPPRY